MGGTYSKATFKARLLMSKQRMIVLTSKRGATVNKNRKELVPLMQNNKHELLWIRVEHIIIDINKDAIFEIITLYLDILLARLDMIDLNKSGKIPEDLAEACFSIIFSAKYLSTEIPELHEIATMIREKFSGDTKFQQNYEQLYANRRLVQLIGSSAKVPSDSEKLEIINEIASNNKIEYTHPKAKKLSPPPQPISNINLNPSGNIVNIGGVDGYIIPANNPMPGALLSSVQPQNVAFNQDGPPQYSPDANQFQAFNPPGAFSQNPMPGQNITPVSAPKEDEFDELQARFEALKKK